MAYKFKKGEYVIANFNNNQELGMVIDYFTPDSSINDLLYVLKLNNTKSNNGVSIVLPYTDIQLKDR
jgi:hypothetical protein